MEGLKVELVELLLSFFKITSLRLLAFTKDCT